MDTTLDIIAVGQVASRLLCPLSTVRRAAEQIGIGPKMRINGVDYFASSDIEAIETRVRAIQFESRNKQPGV